MKKYKVLAVEDESTTQILLQRCLASYYELVVAGSIERAKEVLINFKPDIVLLDIHLPDGDGFDFFNCLKENFQTLRTPVIFLSLESDTQFKVKSFSAGAYDYITKPFDQSELIARINAHCARSIEITAALYVPERFADIVFNKESMQVYKIKKDGSKELLALSPLEFKLLQCFITHVNKTLSREQITKEVWNKTHFQSRTVDRHISSLRKKLGQTGVYLKTVSHGGYLLSADPKEDL